MSTEDKGPRRCIAPWDAPEASVVHMTAVRGEDTLGTYCDDYMAVKAIRADVEYAEADFRPVSCPECRDRAFDTIRHLEQCLASVPVR